MGVRRTMQGKIALEEHFAIEETLPNPKGLLADDVRTVQRNRLRDFDERLRQMDKNGIEMMILSLNAPAVQAIPDPVKANAIARQANDVLAAEVQKRSDRYQAFAALPMQDPDLAAQELKRCIKELGFRGALVNGFSEVQGVDGPVYYDLPQYQPFWQVVAELNVPFYLHPRRPLLADARIYAGHNWMMGPAWAFGQETAVHALRLMASGLFDRHPDLTIILGHLGEGLPYSIWRVDNCNSLVSSRHDYVARKPAAEYFHNNFYVTTSGNFYTQTMVMAIMELGADRVLFSVDWPFEEVDAAASWFDQAAISENDRLKIGRTNAAKLFNLD